MKPTPAEALRRLKEVDPDKYARSRNHIDGAVTRLSPYITHGLLSVPEVLAALRADHDLGDDHKLVFELAWREFFYHAWRHDGEAIFSSLHRGPLADSAYAQALPADIRESRTGIPAIDMAIRSLYKGGYVHNHARMWLASYVVHLRKIHWRVGADWLYAHLLDGDLASNHLSWQWVAGTSSHKPYLFNAENVRKYAPPAWHSDHTAIDISYEALDKIANSHAALTTDHVRENSITEPPLYRKPPHQDFLAPDKIDIKGKDVWLVHPWSLAEPPADLLPVAILDADFHLRWPWSEARWRFVTTRMTEVTNLQWLATAPELVDALRAARSVHGIHNLHLSAAFSEFSLMPMPRAFHDPHRRCPSFSSYWAKARSAK